MRRLVGIVQRRGLEKGVARGRLAAGHYRGRAFHLHHFNLGLDRAAHGLRDQCLLWGNNSCRGESVASFTGSVAKYVAALSTREAVVGVVRIW